MLMRPTVGLAAFSLSSEISNAKSVNVIAIARNQGHDDIEFPNVLSNMGHRTRVGLVRFHDHSRCGLVVRIEFCQDWRLLVQCYLPPLLWLL
jgi:hypothetical protein